MAGKGNNSDEEIVENPTFKAAYNLEPLHHNQRLRWDHQVRLIGEKVFDPQIHLCEKCQYPILVYGRMLPCKHVFCLDCAKKYEKLCPSVNGCRRTYLSKRDLQAHIAHRHSVKASSGPSGVIRHPPPALHVQHPAGQLRMPMAPIQQQPPPTTMESYVTAQVQGMGGGGSGGGISRTNQNLITVPIHDEGADSYHTSRRQPEMSSYPGVPHTVPTAHPTAPPPAAYSSTPPPHLSMPPPGPFSSANLVGVGRIPFSTAPQQLVQAVAHLTHALSQQHRGVHPQRMNIPVSSAPPSRFPTQPPFTAGSPMHWSGAPPRQGQPPPRHQPPPGQRPPGDSGGYNQYY
nr:hypothetical protein BaRGS_014125 [Batillaria attramentaria]